MKHFHPAAGEGNSLATTVPAAALIVTKYDRVPPRLAVNLWMPYADAFEGIRERAAQEHLISYGPFMKLMENRRVAKFVASRDAVPLGLSVMTEHLETWPLVSPPFFAARYPGRRVFYVGLVTSFTSQATGGVFVSLIDRMYQDVIAADGVAVMDWCSANVARRMPQIVARMLESKNPHVRHETIDFQQFDAWDFRPEADDA